jgi:hypothetical protein
MLNLIVMLLGLFAPKRAACCDCPPCPWCPEESCCSE